MNNLIAFIIGVVVFLKLTENNLEKINKYNLEQFSDILKNIYGSSLKKCQKHSNDQSGSWEDGYCTERGGGVHQICFDINNNTKNFAKDTHQGVNWSEGRMLNNKKNNHCMCLGAWSLYKARQNKNEIAKTENELICNAIPDYALSADYVNTWNSWNGNELPNQIQDGVESLVSQCLPQASSNEERSFLINKYCKLAKNIPEMKKSKMYQNKCNVVEGFANSIDYDFAKKHADRKMKEVLDQNTDYSFENMVRKTHEHCANMRFSKSISTALLPIKDKQKENPIDFYISVCCTSDYCEIMQDKFYYEKVNDIYYLFKHDTNKLVQVLTSDYSEEDLFPLITLKKLIKICS